jgi:hypothetical protein
MSKVSNFTDVSIINGDAFLHLLDVSETPDLNKKVKISRFLSPSITLDVGDQVEISNAEILAMNTTPKQILASGGIAPNYRHVYGVVIEYNYQSAAFTNDTYVVLVCDDVEITVRYDILGETANRKIFMTTNIEGDDVSSNAHSIGVFNYYLKCPLGDPLLGGGTMTATPIYRDIISF